MQAKLERAAICFNLRQEHGCGDDGQEEYDELPTIEFLQRQLACFFTQVELCEQNSLLFQRLESFRPQFVVNIAEGRGSTRGRESQVPCILEWLDIPYYGSDPVAMGLTLDKYSTGIFLRQAGVAAPRAWLVSSPDQMRRLWPLDSAAERFIVKPRWEGSSKGIFADSVVRTRADCQQAVERVVRGYRQPALVEEFLPGQEITVGLYGNQEPRVLGMMSIAPAQPTDFFVYSLDHKRDWRQQVVYAAAAASLPPELISRVQEQALMAFRCLELRDVARIDFRVDAAGMPQVIDVNPLPGLSPRYSDVMLLCELHQRDFTAFVRSLFALALDRCGLGSGLPADCVRT